MENTILAKVISELKTISELKIFPETGHWTLFLVPDQWVKILDTQHLSLLWGSFVFKSNGLSSDAEECNRQNFNKSKYL